MAEYGQRLMKHLRKKRLHDGAKQSGDGKRTQSSNGRRNERLTNLLRNE